MLLLAIMAAPRHQRLPIKVGGAGVELWVTLKILIISNLGFGLFLYNYIATTKLEHFCKTAK